MDKSQIASEEEMRKYLLKTDQDYEILDKIHQLEKRVLTVEDASLVQFIRTQLEDDWRTPILDKLNELEKRYALASTD